VCARVCGSRQQAAASAAQQSDEQRKASLGALPGRLAVAGALLGSVFAGADCAKLRAAEISR
jgi:hypothetical protein